MMNEQMKYYEDKLRYEVDSADLYNYMQDKSKVIVIDTRTEEFYDGEHIPMAINIPHRMMDELTTKDLDKSFMYVMYCDGIGCNGSTKGTLNMLKLGFTVRELIGGLDWWIRDGHETDGSEGVSANNTSCGC